MSEMEGYANQALQRWRNLRETVTNPKRRFRLTANPTKLNSAATAAAVRELIQDACVPVSSQVRPAIYPISAAQLGSVVESRDVKMLEDLGGVAGVAEKLSTTLADGITNTDATSLTRRRGTYGDNKFRGAMVFWRLVLMTLLSLAYTILVLYALLCMVLGIATEGWPAGAFDGISTVLVVLLSAIATAWIDYPQSLTSVEIRKGKIVVRVKRNGSELRMLWDDLLVGDIVSLSAGHEVPADGLFVSGSSTSTNESSLSGRGNEQVVISCDQNPFLLRGAKIEEGTCTMMVIAVGMRTGWAKKLLAKLCEGKENEEETTLQLRLNRAAIVIGRLCLLYEVVMFAVLVYGFVLRKFEEGNQWNWSGDDAMELLEILALAITGRSKSGKHELKGFIRSQVCKHAFFPG